jgi:DNA-binding IclR family transcriptional regulator
MKRVGMTPNTVTDIQGLSYQLEVARNLGYAINNQEAFIGDISVAAPILNHKNLPIGAVNIAVPSPRWRIEDVLSNLVPQLLKTAAAINRGARLI